MPYSFETSSFEHPPLLEEIFRIEKNEDRAYLFSDVLFWKDIQLKRPLSREERMFRNAEGLHAEIMSGGWHSSFYQLYSRPDWTGTIELNELLSLRAQTS